MTRFGAWLLCCAAILFALATMGGNVDIHRLLALLGYTGIPLFIHWCFSSEKATEGDENV